MEKPTLTWLWLLGLLLTLAGLATAVIARASGGGDVQYLTPQNFVHHLDGGAVLAIVLGSLVAIVGGVLQFTAWVGAVVVTGMLERWGWFAALIALGLIGLGFFVMLAYVIAGPTTRSDRAPAGPPLAA